MLSRNLKRHLHDRTHDSCSCPNLFLPPASRPSPHSYLSPRFTLQHPLDSAGRCLLHILGLSERFQYSRVGVLSSNDVDDSGLRPAKIPTRVDHPSAYDSADDEDFENIPLESAKIPSTFDDADAAEFEELDEELDIEDENPEAASTRVPDEKEEVDGSFGEQDEI